MLKYFVPFQYGLVLLLLGIHRGLGVDISKVRSLRMDKVFSERSTLIKVNDFFYSPKIED